MLKYKKKRIVRLSLTVFIPLFLVGAVFITLRLYRQVDFQDIDLISKTKSIFSPSDKKAPENVKMTEPGSHDKAVSPVDSNQISNEEDSLSIPDPEMEEITLVAEHYFDIDTANIQKDVMIAKKTYRIPIDKNEKHLDSLLANTYSTDKDYTLTLEFWLSPIGFTGYKKSVNKAVIFGVHDAQNSDLLIADHNFYLIVNNAVYLLEPSNSFAKLIQQNSKSQ
jgi:hypothetical protein